MADPSQVHVSGPLEPFAATDVERFLSVRRGAGYTQYLTGKTIRPMLTYLRDQGVSLPPPPAVANGPVDVAIERYRQYLTNERGPWRVRGLFHFSH